MSTALHAAGLDRLWDALAARLQRNGLRPTGVVVLEGLTREERHALAGLTGRATTGDRLRIDVAALDRRLRDTQAAAGLVAAVEERRGPLVDRKGHREALAVSRARMWSTVRAEISAQGLQAGDWIESWLEDVRPTANRLDPERASSALVTAVRAMARLPWDGPRVGRTEFAASVAGSSHSLDDGRTLAAMILRGIATKLGEPPPRSAAEYRSLWQRAGVQPDEVSTTVLTLRLAPEGESEVARGVRTRTDAGYETHLTLRDLGRLGRLVKPVTTVWVCENPRVLEAAMDAGTGAVMVCTAGNPVLVVRAVLARLAEEGADLRYRGDFDWPGIGIANQVMSSYQARPWRMCSADYEAALAGAGAEVIELPLLEGSPVEASWDGGLAATMARRGRVVHEELLLEELISDLSSVLQPPVAGT
jgi:uncharacterized protein (TIGR02679 family)